MAHEKSITVDDGEGGFVNIKSSGFKNESEAQREFLNGRNPPLGGKSFKTVEKAVNAARIRSAKSGQKRGR